MGFTYELCVLFLGIFIGMVIGVQYQIAAAKNGRQ
jgi:hypothetical protein